jgi:catechol 2,3-dioxygenase-like lactoylglutathione lyase family enzyme
MGAKINHIAIVAENYAQVAQFYQFIFGFRAPPEQKVFNAVTIGDGYVGLNLNPRRPARNAGLDHFGIEVEDVEHTMDRLKQRYPEVHVLKRLGNRKFAGYTTHDPDGNILDLSQRQLANRGEIYTENELGWQQKRTVSHYGVRTLHPERMAEFYADMFGLTPANKQPGDPNQYMSDGRVTLTLMPWDILDFDNTGIVRAGPHHIGIKVESLESFKADLDHAVAENPSLAPTPLAVGREGEALRKNFAESVPYAAMQLADNTHVLLAVNAA